MWNDGLDMAANFAAGWGDTLTFGATWGLRGLYGGNAHLDPESIAYQVGTVTGYAHQFGLGFYGCGAGWAGSMARGYEVVSNLGGMAQSSSNIANGQAGWGIC
jgi:hypothetical protein